MESPPVDEIDPDLLKGLAAQRMERLKHEVLRAARVQGPFTWPGPLIPPPDGRLTPTRCEEQRAKRARASADFSPEKLLDERSIASLESLRPCKQGKFKSFGIEESDKPPADVQLEEDAYDLLSVVVNQLFEDDGGEDAASVETEATWSDSGGMTLLTGGHELL